MGCRPDSGARCGRNDRELRRAPRGVTRAGSLPVPGTEGGRDGRRGFADCPGKALGGPLDRTTELNPDTDAGPVLPPTKEDTSLHALPESKRDTGDKMAGGAGISESRGRGS